MTTVEAGRLGRPIRGPSALGSDPSRLLQLSVTLATLEFKLRFFGSVLGYFWQLMRPLMLFGILYVVFTQFVSWARAFRTTPRSCSPAWCSTPSSPTPPAVR